MNMLVQGTFLNKALTVALNQCSVKSKTCGCAGHLPGVNMYKYINVKQGDALKVHACSANLSSVTIGK